MLEQVTDSLEWNKQILINLPVSGGFLQSWEWGEFQKAAGRTVYRFCGVPSTQYLVPSCAQVIEMPLSLGKTYWFAPRGPVFITQKGAENGSLAGSGFPISQDGLSPNEMLTSWQGIVKFSRSAAGPQLNRTPQGKMIGLPESPDRGPSATDQQLFYHELSEVAKKHNVIFFRLEPIEHVPSTIQQTYPVSPPATLLLDLVQTEDELLAQMHEKTRYNIRLAQRKGVKVFEGQGISDFEKFWKLMEETARRDGFRTHERGYYQKMLEVLNPTTCSAKLWFAEWEGKTLAAGIWIYFADTATYLHGASSSRDRNVMAPYALHWQVIRDAKEHGYKAYDFWGIQPNTYNLKPTTSWAGLSRFKLGFAGQPIEFPGTFDLPISRTGYTLYKLARKIRRLG